MAIRDAPLPEQPEPVISVIRKVGGVDANLAPPGRSPAAGHATNNVNGILRVLAERELPSGRGGIFVWLWTLAVPMLWVAVSLGLVSGEWEWFLGLLLALLTGRTVSRLSLENCHRRAALLLPELDGAWIGPLVETLAFANPTVRSIARLRLTTVLPTIEASEETVLTDAQRALLFDQLTPRQAASQSDLVEAILRFASATGDEFALDGALRLASARAFTGGQRRVRRAARQSLLRLEQAAAEKARTLKGEEQQDTQAARDDIREDLSPEARALLEQAEDDSKSQPGMRFGFLLAVWGVVLPYCVIESIAGFAHGNWLAGFCFGAGTALVSQAYRFALTPHQTRVAAHMASLDDVEAVGPLAEMLYWPDDRIKVMAAAALTRLLPRMNASDTQLLSTTQRALLYQTLRLPNAQKQAEFLVALLHALEQVGDINAIPLVRSLAEAQPASLRQKRVIDAARSCLPALEGCAQQNQDSQVLLRATTSESEESLLRPAASRSDASVELLVRAAQGAAEDAG
jgi:hypothetical protein